MSGMRIDRPFCERLKIASLCTLVRAGRLPHSHNESKRDSYPKWAKTILDRLGEHSEYSPVTAALLFGVRHLSSSAAMFHLPGWYNVISKSHLPNLSICASNRVCNPVFGPTGIRGFCFRLISCSLVDPQINITKPTGF